MFTVLWFEGFRESVISNQGRGLRGRGGFRGGDFGT